MSGKYYRKILTLQNDYFFFLFDMTFHIHSKREVALQNQECIRGGLALLN